MVYNLEELVVVALIIVIVLVLSLFFGIFWAVLLVFTFLWLLYQFGRPTRRKKSISTSIIMKTCETDSKSADMSETIYADKEMVVPFTGLPSPKGQSVRSPMPLLSTVTKRLSFNLNSSTLSPLDNHRTSFNRRSFGSPLSPIVQHQSPRNFSLINPKLQCEPTIKIAPPPVDNRRPLHLQEEANGLVQDPLSRSSILSALKQSTARKRSVNETEEEDNAAAQPQNQKKKRRFSNTNEVSEVNKSMNRTVTALNITEDVVVDPPDVTHMTGINKLIQTRLKRRPLRGSVDNDYDNDSIKESLPKKTRSYSGIDRLSQLKESKVVNIEEQEKADSTPTYGSSNPIQVQANDAKSATKPALVDKNDSDSGCDADDDDDIIMKSAPTCSDKPSKRQVAVEDNMRTKRLRDESPNCTPTKRVSKQQMLSRKQRELSTPCSSDATSSPGKQSSSDRTDSPGQKCTPKKRFTIVRFPSKNSEAKRRPVPVYCASVNSPDLPKRRAITHKITKEDIELDRKLAWQRIQSFLDASDEEEDKEGASTTSPSVALNVVTCLASPSKSLTSTPAISGGLASIGNVSTASFPSITQIPSITTTAISTSSLATSQPSSGITQSQPLQNLTTSSSMPVLSTSLSIQTPSGTSLTTSNSSTASGLIPDTFAKPTVLNSATSSSQSIQTPICTPAIQIPSGVQTISTTPAMPAAPVSISLSFDSGTLPSQVQTTNPLTGGPSVSNPLLAVSKNTNSPLLGSSNTNPPQGFATPKPLRTSLFSGLSGSPLSSNESIKPATSGEGSKLSAAPTAPTSSFTLAFTTADQTKSLGFGIQQTANATPTSVSGSFTVPTGGQSVLPTGSSQSTFGASVSTQSGFILTGNKTSISGFTQNTNPAGALTNLPSDAGRKTSFSFGAAGQGTVSTVQGGFGTLTAKPTFGSANTQSPFGTATAIGTFGSPAVTSTTQSTFGGNPTPSSATTSIFGASTFPSTSQNAFGAPTVSAISQNTFAAAPTTTPNVFGSSTATTAAQNGFGSALNASKPAFGSQTTPSVFGKPAASGGFGSFNTQNVFGSQPGSQNNAGGFSFGSGATTAVTTTSTSGGFNFAAGSGTTAGPANTGGFNFGSGSTNSTTKGFAFGSGGINATTGSDPNPNQFSFSAGNNATTAGANPSGGFNFSRGSNNAATAAPAASGGFNFGSSGTTNSGGFNFGSGSSSTPGGFQFGAAGGTQQSAAPTFGATAPGGFSFGGGSATPTFGASNQGGFAFGSGSQTPSSAVAKPRPKNQARRRPRK